MPSSEQLGQAMRAAALAGDEASARRLAQAYREAQSAEGGASAEPGPTSREIIGGILERQRAEMGRPVEEVSRQATAAAVNALPIATTALGAAMGAPLGPPGMAAGGALGALAGARGSQLLRGDPELTGSEIALEAAIGASGPLVGSAAGKFFQRLRGPAAPTIAELSAKATSLYDRARQAGVQIAGDSWERAVGRMAHAASQGGINRNLHPKAMGVLRDMLKTRGAPLSLDDAEQWRRVLKGVGKSLDPDERRIGKILVEQFDRWQGSLKAADVLAGEPEKAVGYLREARQIWQRVKKGELLGDMIANAELGKSKFTQAGVENALRAEFRRLAKNANKMRMFSKEERAAIIDVANGKPFRNAMQRLGKFAPKGVVSTALGGGGGAMAGSLLGLDPVTSGLATMGAGSVGHWAATKGTQAAAREAQEMMLRGFALPPPSPQPAVNAAALAAALQAGSRNP